MSILTIQASETMEEPLYIDKAARFLGLKKGTIYNMVSRREIAHYKLGNRVFFKKSDLEEWFESKRVKPKREADSEYVKYLAQKILAETLRT